MLSWLKNKRLRPESSGSTPPLDHRALSLEDESQIFRFLFHSSNKVIFWTDETGNVLESNQTACDLLGYSRQELSAMNFADIVPNITPRKHQQIHDELAAQGTTTIQAQPRCKDGTFASMEFTIEQIAIGDRTYFCTVGHKIALEQRLRDEVLSVLATESSLTKILELITELAENTRDGMSLCISLQGESETIGKQIPGLIRCPNLTDGATTIHHETPTYIDDVGQSPLWQDYLEHAQAAGIVACWSLPIFCSLGRLKGSLIAYFSVALPSTQHDKELLKTLASLAGIAIEKVYATEELRISEVRNRSLVQSFSAIVWTASADGEFVAPQESWEAYTGQPWSEHQGAGWLAMIHQDDRDRIANEWQQTIDQRVPISSEGRFWSAEKNAYRYFEVVATPILDGDELIEWVGCTTDVHDQKIAAKKLQRTQAILAQAQQVAQLGTWIYNTRTNQAQWTLEFCRIHEIPPTQRDGDFEKLIANVIPQDQKNVRESLQSFIAGGPATPFEYRVAAADGTLKTIACKIWREVNPDSGHIHLLGTSLDLSDLRKAEQALRQSERQLRMITDSVPVMIAYVDREYRFQFNNAMYETRFGKTKHELRGQHITEILGQNIFKRVKPNFDAAFGGTVTKFTQRIELPDGSHRINDVRLVPDQISDGSTIGVYVLVDDATERHALEKELLSVAAKEQSRFGQDLHDGAGQELTGLGMIADTLALSLSRKDAPEQQIAKKLAAGIKRCLRTLKELARGLNPVDVSSSGLRSAITEMADHVEDLYSLKCDFICDLPTTIDDNQIATQLFRIVQEATTNAAKHGQAQQITIRLWGDKDEANLAIVDDGIGISPPTQSQRGMGLRTMKYRAGVIGGSLSVSRRPSGGTEVKCTFAFDQEPESTSSTPKPVRQPFHLADN